MSFNSTTVLKIPNYNHYCFINFVTTVPKDADKTYLLDSGVERDTAGIKKILFFFWNFSKISKKFQILKKKNFFFKFSEIFKKKSKF